MAAIFGLAMRDSLHLPTGILAVWMFAPFIRRVVDWKSGGFVPVTAISLLPILATVCLVIPIWPRLKRLPIALRQPLGLLVVPTILAGLIGFARYGPSAGLETLSWLSPTLFIPYFATRLMSNADRKKLLQASVFLAALTAAYGVYQFLVLPPWDRQWLVQSGMTSSMGQPSPMKMRTWGTLNSTGPAGAVWALSLIMLTANRSASMQSKILLGLALVASVATSLVRTSWIMFAVGIITLAAFSRGPERARVIGLLAFAGCVTILALPFLPGSQRVTDRFGTFGKLEEDRSLQVRISTGNEMISTLLDNPLGAGIGYKTAGKISGSSKKIMAVDNGIGDLALTLSVPGAVAWLSGLAGLFNLLRRRIANRMSESDEYICRVALALTAASSIALGSAFSFAGVTGILTWFTIGLANNGASASPATRRSSLSAYRHHA